MQVDWHEDTASECMSDLPKDSVFRWKEAEQYTKPKKGLYQKKISPKKW